MFWWCTPSAAGENSQMALQFDHLELKGGQSVPVHSQIQSIAPAGSAASGSAVSAPPASGSPSASGANGSSRASGAPQAAGGDPGTAPAGNSGPAPGTIVAKTGNIAIRTTSIPGVLVANNAPGQQDPRMGAGFQHPAWREARYRTGRRHTDGGWRLRRGRGNALTGIGCGKGHFCRCL